MKYLAKIVSALFSPIFMPTIAMYLAMWQTYLVFSPLKARLTILLFTFAITCMLQFVVIYILNRFGVVKDPGLNNRRERTIPYIIGILSYLAVASFLGGGGTPTWMPMFMVGAAFVALVNLLVNLKWKISGHSAGVGGLLALVFYLSLHNYTLYSGDLLFLITVVLAGLVMTSRLYLHRHTLGQVIAGLANGFIFVSLAELLVK